MVRDDSINCPDANRVINGLGVETCVIILTVVDLLAISTELLIRLEVVQDPKSPTTVSQISQTSIAPINGSNLQDPDPGGTCQECIMGTPIETAHCVSHYISVCIAGIFMLEIVARLVAGCPGCWKDTLQIFDGFVIVIVFVMELLFTIFWKQVICYNSGIEATTYIIALRLLRIPRACSVRKKQYAERLENEMHYLRKAKSKSEEQARELSHRVRKQQKEIADLSNKLASVSTISVTYSTENPSIPSPPPSQTSANSSPHVSNGTLPNGSFNTYAEQTSSEIMKSAKDEVEQNIKIRQNSVQYKAMLGDITSRKDRTNQSIRSKVSTSSDKSSSNNSKANSPNKETHKTSNSVKRNQSDKDALKNDSGDKSISANEKSVPNSVTENEVIGQLENIVKDNQIPHSEKNEAMRNSAQSIEIEDDEACLITRNKMSQSGQENKAFTDDEESEEVVVKRRQNLEVMAEYEGTRTYRSAEGIPLTDL